MTVIDNALFSVIFSKENEIFKPFLSKAVIIGTSFSDEKNKNKYMKKSFLRYLTLPFKLFVLRKSPARKYEF